MEVIKRLNELLGQSTFIVLEPLLTSSKRSLFDILDLELYGLAWDRWETYVEIGFHCRLLSLLICVNLFISFDVYLDQVKVN